MEADAETDADAEADTGTDIMEENAALMEQDADAMEENVEAEAKGSEDPQSFQCVQCNATYTCLQNFTRHQHTKKHRDNVDPDGAEQRKKTKADEAEPRKKAKAAESHTSKVAEAVARLEKKVKEAKEKAANDAAKATKKRNQQTKSHQSKVDARKAVSSSEHHCEACNASFKSSKALKGHEQSLKHQDNFDPEGAEPRKKARADEAQARLATPEGKAAAEKKKAAAEKTESCGQTSASCDT